jgi:hypothetical protein
MEASDCSTKSQAYRLIDLPPLVDGIDLLCLKNTWAVVPSESTRPDLAGFDATSTVFPDGWDARDDSAMCDIIAMLNKEERDKSSSITFPSLKPLMHHSTEALVFQLQ